MSRSGLISIAAGVAGGLALAIIAAWFFLLRDTAEPVNVADVITTFREAEESATSVEGPLPKPAGVYLYATDGYEKTDALTGVTHRYPLRSTITVTKDACGVRMRWDVLKGRSTTWTYCLASGGWEIASQDERHTFFGRTERTTYVCEDTPIRPGRDTAGAHWDVSCATDTSEEAGTGTVVGGALLAVSGRRVATVQVRKTTSFTGEIRGTTTHDIWFARESGVPVRIAMVSRTTNDSPVGDVHYEEDVTLRLTSLTPRR
jgi:hypothetical protein